MRLFSTNQKQNQNYLWLALREFSRAWNQLHVSRAWYRLPVIYINCDWLKSDYYDSSLTTVSEQNRSNSYSIYLHSSYDVRKRHIRFKLYEYYIRSDLLVLYSKYRLSLPTGIHLFTVISDFFHFRLVSLWKAFDL